VCYRFAGFIITGDKTARFHDIDENLEQGLTTFVNDTGDNLQAVTTYRRFFVASNNDTGEQLIANIYADFRKNCQNVRGLKRLYTKVMK
jgi:hypothetical protein